MFLLGSRWCVTPFWKRSLNRLELIFQNMLFNFLIILKNSAIRLWCKKCRNFRRKVKFWMGINSYGFILCFLAFTNSSLSISQSLRTRSFSDHVFCWSNRFEVDQLMFSTLNIQSDEKIANFYSTTISGHETQRLNFRHSFWNRRLEIV